MEGNDLFKEAKESILNYMQASNTDYSIMLSGDWGCGKTCFVRNTLLNQIENIKKKVIYLSASSITSIDDFINKLYLKCFLKEYESSEVYTIAKSDVLISISPIISKLLPEKIKPVLETIADISSDVTKEKIDFKDVLIVIDDLERLSENINMDTFLYSVFDSFISKNVKVLFVGNEEIIDKEKYNRIKEKIIRHTIKLHSLDNESFKYLAKDIAYKFIKEDDFFKYFIDKIFFDIFIERTINIFVMQELFNLRIFIKFLDMSKCILELVDSSITDENAKLWKHKDIFTNILSIFALTITEFESKNKNIFIDFCKSKDIEIKLFRNNARKSFGLPKEYEDGNEKKVKEYFNDTLLDKFKKMEIGYKQNMLITFYNYLETGYFEHQNIINEYKDILYADEEYNEASNVLYYLTYYNSKEVKNAIETIVYKIKNNISNFNRDSVLRTYACFLHTKYLFNKKEIDRFYKIFENAIETILKEYSIEQLNHISDKFFDSLYLTNMHKDYPNDKLLKFEKELIKKLIKENIEKETPVVLEIVRNFNERNIDYFGNIKYCRNIEYKYLYLIFLKTTLAKINKTPFTISVFNYYINDRQIEIINATNMYKAYTQNQELKQPIIDNIQEYISSIKTKDKHFQKVIENLQDSIKTYLESNK